MPGLDPVISEWVQKAEEDLKVASHALKLGTECPPGAVCFHAEQCIEKYLKALLVSLRSVFPKTHNILHMLDLLPIDRRPALSRAECLRFTDYATVMRYPGEYEPLKLSEARKAVSIARRVRREVRKHLPQQALRAKRQ